MPDHTVRIAELRARIVEVRARLPKHTPSVAMLLELDELEAQAEALEDAQQRSCELVAPAPANVSADYTLTELMAVTAAREIADGEIVFAGTGLPMLATMLAQHTHAPHCCIVFQAGTVDSQLTHLPMSVGDPRAMRGAALAAGLSEIFAYVLQAGRIDVGFLSGAQIDRYGNINSTSIGDPLCPDVRFAGSGGACDVACLSKRTVIMAKHEKRRLPAQVDYLTSPGWLTGSDARSQAGLVRGGPSALVTTKAVLRYRPHTHEAYLASYHPGLTPKAVVEDTGFSLDVSEAMETPMPTAEELRILREVVDPERVFLR